MYLDFFYFRFIFFINIFTLLRENLRILPGAGKFFVAIFERIGYTVIKELIPCGFIGYSFARLYFWRVDQSFFVFSNNVS